MLVRVIKEGTNLVAVCDSALIGKKFKEGKFQLDLSGDFFRGNETPKKETIKIMQDMNPKEATFNIVGEESVNTAVEAGIISKQGIKKIQEIPFALILL